MPKQKRRDAETMRENAALAGEYAAARRAQARIEDTEASACCITGKRVTSAEASFDSGWRLANDAPRTMRETVSRLLDVDLTADEAVAAVAAVDEPLWHRDRDGADPTDPGNAKPFAWITDKHVEQMRRAVDEHRTKDRPRRWIGGRGCGWCGVRKSTAWFVSTFKYPDRGEAVLCELCNDAYERAGRPAVSGDDWRAALLRRITGYAPNMLDPVARAARAFCEVRRDDYGGTDTPFAWVPRETIAELMTATHGRWPSGAPDRTEAKRWARLYRLRAQQAERQHREAAEREQAATSLRW